MYVVVFTLCWFFRGTPAAASDVRFVVEASEQVQEEEGLCGQQDVDYFGVVAGSEEHLSVVDEDNAELYLKQRKCDWLQVCTFILCVMVVLQLGSN